MNKDNATKFKSVLVLFDLLNKISQKDIHYLKELYLKNAQDFEDCIDFLSVLNLINSNSGQITLHPQLKKFLFRLPNENEIKEFLLDKLLSKRYIYIWEYLEKFSAYEDKYIFEPKISENLRFSNLRNLLIELDFISYNSSERFYEINEKYIPLFFEIIREHSISPEKLKKVIEEQDKIGRCAELEIIEYEKSRLSSRRDLLSSIQHKSLEDTTAGYDIKSFTLKEDSSVTERFIEVKAISKFEHKFYLSRNELETSQKHGLQYYLYLLPVAGNCEFDISNLIIIQNPSISVFKSDDWSVECEKYEVKRKEHN